MGLSPYPPRSLGFLGFVCFTLPLYLLALLPRLFDAVLLALRLPEDPSGPAPAAPDSPAADLFRTRFPPVRFGAAGPSCDCRVCLDGFEPDSPVRRLSCGHVFHSDCLDTWLRFYRATCPLCRSYLLDADDAAGDALE